MRHPRGLLVHTRAVHRSAHRSRPLKRSMTSLGPPLRGMRSARGAAVIAMGLAHLLGGGSDSNEGSGGGPEEGRDATGEADSPPGAVDAGSTDAGSIVANTTDSSAAA